MFGSPGFWPVDGVGDIDDCRMFVTAAIRRLEGNIGKCVRGGLQEGWREMSEGRSVGNPTLDGV